MRRSTTLALALSMGTAALGAREIAAQPPAAPAAGRSETWMQYCSVCHGDDGRGQTEEGRKKKARDFTKKDWQQSVDDARLQKSITKGRDKMPEFGKKLNADEIKALVQEIRALAK